MKKILIKNTYDVRSIILVTVVVKSKDRGSALLLAQLFKHVQTFFLLEGWTLFV